ncbi:Hypothetical predicted protein [Olea europaea subsp. europaea]|uniref:Uncharacterized protein n=1 Tax=Olea europaea subsp. europaea TaxID=158383 RepID=A0A8S0RXL1_OLEEU|nr:Hypothetical predicted protein [Olea europaea subsp. europaea]
MNVGPLRQCFDAYVLIIGFISFTSSSHVSNGSEIGPNLDIINLRKAKNISAGGVNMLDNICAHDACRPAINFAVELMYASTVFQVSKLVSLSDLESITIEIELPYNAAEDIRLLRLNSLAENEMKLMLSTMLDEAYAFHYAVAYCDPNIVSEVLGLGLADVNLQNKRGHTELHIAAMRNEPSIIVSLFNQGSQCIRKNIGRTVCS